MSQPSPSTFLENYVQKNVCSHKSIFMMPAVPALLFVNVFEPVLFGCAWGVVIFIWLVIWLIVPCNPNLNCTATLVGRKQGKDGTKALLVAFLISYALLFAIAIAARLIVCVKEDPQPSAYGGGILTNLKVFEEKIPIKGSHQENQLRDQLKNEIKNSIKAHSKEIEDYTKIKEYVPKEFSKDYGSLETLLR